MLICTHPDQTARQELQIAVLMPDMACHRRYRSEESDWKLGFQGGWCYTRVRKAGYGFEIKLYGKCLSRKVTESP